MTSSPEYQPIEKSFGPYRDTHKKTYEELEAELAEERIENDVFRGTIGSLKFEDKEKDYALRAARRNEQSAIEAQKTMQEKITAALSYIAAEVEKERSLTEGLDGTHIFRLNVLRMLNKELHALLM